MKIVQVVLRNKDNELLTTWVDDRPDLHIGARVKLKDFKPTIEWEVISLFGMKHDSKDFDFHRKWTNNI